MRNLLRTSLRTRPLALLAVAGVLLIALIAYRRNNHDHAKGGRTAQAAARKAHAVLVTFEGPWAFARDPNDANSVFAFAPKTKTHHDLVVETGLAPSETRQAALLPAGIYQLSLPAASSGVPKIDANVLQATIDAQGVQHALGARLERYAIRLPRPVAYVATSTERTRAGSTYPPAPSTEKDYVTAVALRYSADTLSGFVLNGHPDDDSAFRPVPVETEVIHFAIEPLPGQMMEECNLHVREAFRDLAKLVNLKLFVDFPDDPSVCRDRDPQKPPA